MTAALAVLSGLLSALGPTNAHADDLADQPGRATTWQRLREHAIVASSWDRFEVRAATESAVRIMRQLGTRAVPHIEGDELEALHGMWLAIASDPTAWPRSRVAAIEIVGRLAELPDHIPELSPLPNDAVGLFGLAPLLRDPDPAIRRAVAEAVPAPTPKAAVAVLARMVADDKEPAVALAAAQPLCGDLASSAAAPVLVSLGERGIRRLQELLSSPAVRVFAGGAVVDAARCLARDCSAPSQAALRAASRLAAPSVRQAMSRKLR